MGGHLGRARLRRGSVTLLALLVSTLLLSGEGVTQIMPTPGPTQPPQPTVALPCPCTCPVALGEANPCPIPPPTYSCPAILFDSCFCEPAAIGTLCGTNSIAKLKYDDICASVLACVNEECPCPEGTDPDTRNCVNCGLVPPDGCAPGHDCGFIASLDCGPICQAFQGVYEQICSVLNAAEENKAQCVTIGVNGSSMDICCPQGTRISGCGPWSGPDGSLDGNCHVFGGSCSAATYICKCPGIQLTCEPDGEPPPPTATPSEEATPTPDPATPTPPGPVPTPTFTATSTNTPAVEVTVVPTATPTGTATPTVTATATATATSTATPEPGSTATPTPTPSPVPGGGGEVFLRQ